MSAGLGREGGGTAVMARLIASAAAEFARSRGLLFRVLSLTDALGCPPGVDWRSFGGSKLGLVTAVWRSQIHSSCAGMIFDHPGPARMQALMPTRATVPYLVFLYGIDIWRRQGWGQMRSLRQAELLVTISKFSEKRARETLPWLDQIDVLHPALEENEPDGEIDAGILESCGLGYLLSVGRMSASERYKGHDQLLSSLPRLLAHCPSARLVFAGGGDDRARLESRVGKMGLREHVEFTGFVSESTLRELYRRCAGFVMPSREEGFGLVYLEAMRARRPCIAATGSAAEEIVLHDQTGLLVDRDDPSEVAEACARLLLDPSYADRLGENGYRRWLERFGYERFRAGLVPQLEQLTGLADVRH